MKRKTVFAFLLCVLFLLSGCKIENKHKPDPEPVQPPEKTENTERAFNDGTWSLVRSVFKTGEYSAVNFFTSLNGAVGDGVYDDTAAIQTTLNKALRSGGGTVYIPHGKYRITKPVMIPENVSLVGDFVSPTSKRSADEGTLFIIAETEELSEESAFVLSDHSSVSDFTVWYEGQTYGSIKQTPYTIRHASGESATVKNIAILNTYNGIFASSPDCKTLFIENIYLTAFKNGIRIDNCSENLTMKGVSISPVYWINDEKTEKAEGFDASFLNDAAYANLNAVTIGNVGNAFVSDITVDTAKTGLILNMSDAELSNGSPYFSFINISNAFNAVQITSAPASGAYFAFSSFGTSNLLDTKALSVGKDFVSSLSFYECQFPGRPSSAVKSEGTGRMSFVGCTFVGWLDSAVDSTDIIVTSVNSSFNAGSFPYKLSDSTAGLLALCSTAVSEEDLPNILTVKTENEYSFSAVDKTRFSSSVSGPKIRDSVYYASDYGVSEALEDNSPAIQSAINYAYLNGGGTVFVPAGQYRVKSPIKVKKGVILRGVGANGSDRITSTVLLSEMNAADDASLVTLESSSGISGFSLFYYRLPDFASAETENLGKAVFAENQNDLLISELCLIRPSVGIRLDGCSSVSVRNISGTTIERGLSIENSEEISCENVFFDSSYATSDAMILYRQQKYRGLYVYGGENIRIRNFRCEDADYAVYLDSEDVPIVPSTPSLTVLGLYAENVYASAAIGKYPFASFVNVLSEPAVLASNAYHITTFSGNRGKTDIANLSGGGTVTGGLFVRSGNLNIFSSAFLSLGKSAVIDYGGNIVAAGCLFLDNGCAYHVEADAGSVFLLGNVTNPEAAFEGTDKKYVRKYVSDEASYADDGNIRGILP